MMEPQNTPEHQEANVNDISGHQTTAEALQDIDSGGGYNISQVSEKERYSSQTMSESDHQIQTVLASSLEKENVALYDENDENLHMLYRAVEDGDLDTLEELVYKNCVDLNICFNRSHLVKKSHWGWSPLHLAAAHGNVTMAKYLVAQGADVMTTTSERETVLHIAAKYGAAEVVSFLLDCNIFLRDIQNNKGITPLLKAIFNSQLAFKGNYRRCVDLLLGARCNPNISSPSNVTALHLAVVKGDSFLVKDLLSHGAHVNTVCAQGSTPLIRALVANNVNTQIISELLAAGADPTLQVNGRSLLHIAVSRCDDRTIEAFLRNGADPNCKDAQGITPLSIAVEENNIKVVPILVAGGGDINYLRMPQSMSLLSQAVVNNSLMMVKLLLSLGASPCTETLMWSTPLHLAVDQQNVEIICELLRANCPLNTTSTAKCSLRPMTPIQEAMELGNMTIVRLLAQSGAVIQPSWLKSDRLPLALSTRPEAVRQLQDMLNQVPSLLHLSRIKVRDASGDRFTQLMTFLRSHSIVPTKILAYLALEDIDCRTSTGSQKV